MGRMTLVVFVFVLMCVIAGILMLRSGVGRRGHGMCPDRNCRRRNPPEAEYCAGCGRRLG